jgi:hypothetical protein
MVVDHHRHYYLSRDYRRHYPMGHLCHYQPFVQIPPKNLYLLYY